MSTATKSRNVNDCAETIDWSVVSPISTHRVGLGGHAETAFREGVRRDRGPL